MVEHDHLNLTAHVKASGCAAKISAAQLHEIVSGLPALNLPQLLTTIGSFEDAAVYKLSDDTALVSTVDFFPPVVDDPYLFGRIAAVNALSDVYAMGGKPLLALSVLCFPVCDFPISTAQQIVRGGFDAVASAGAALAGGHSIQSAELIYGLCVIGAVHPQKMLTNGGAKVADTLVLSKALGTGVLLLGMKAGMLSASAAKALTDNLSQLNGAALACAQNFSVHACTDVTGFGLIGHVHEMARAAGLKATLNAKSLPLLPEAISLAEQGLVPAAAYANRSGYEKVSYINDGIDLSVSDLLFDPQTSGGLLFALEEQEAEQLCADLKQHGLVGVIIGRFEEGPTGQVEVV